MPVFSRRDFLKQSALGLGAAALAACQIRQIPASVSPTIPPPASLTVTPLAPTLSPRLVISPSAPPASTPTRSPNPTTQTKAKDPNPNRVEDAPKGKAPTSLPAAAEVKPSPGIILGRPTRVSVALSVLLNTDQQSVVAYGTSPAELTQKTPAVALRANIPQMVEISQLKPNTTYYYQVFAGGAPVVDAPGETRRFTTQRAPGSSFVFTLDADPHNRDSRFNGELYTTALTNALADRPDFHVNLGDTFMTEKLSPQSVADVERVYQDMRPYLGVIGAGAPLFLVNGNHEGEVGWAGRTKDKNLPLWCTQVRQRYYPNPMPGGFYSGSASKDPLLGAPRDGYYAWTWGDALFIALDPYWYTLEKPHLENLSDQWNWSLGKEQYTWLKSTLAGSSAKFKFVFLHHLVGGAAEGRGGVEFAHLFEWGGKNMDGSYGFDKNRPDWGKPIHQLLVDARVSAVFHGHDHVYVQQELDGIVYLEMPQPNITDYNNWRIAAEYGYTRGKILGSSGHVRVSVTPSRATIEYVRAYLKKDEKSNQKNGQVDDSYVIS